MSHASASFRICLNGETLILLQLQWCSYPIRWKISSQKFLRSYNKWRNTTFFWLIHLGLTKCQFWSPLQSGYGTAYWQVFVFVLSPSNTAESKLITLLLSWLVLVFFFSTVSAETRRHVLQKCSESSESTGMFYCKMCYCDCKSLDHFRKHLLSKEHALEVNVPSLCTYINTLFH